MSFKFLLHYHTIQFKSPSLGFPQQILQLLSGCCVPGAMRSAWTWPRPCWTLSPCPHRVDNRAGLLNSVSPIFLPSVCHIFLRPCYINTFMVMRLSLSSRWAEEPDHVKVWLGAPARMGVPIPFAKYGRAVSPYRLPIEGRKGRK